jgi:protein-tyrosine phosphatase
VDWDYKWIQWPDFRLPSNPTTARDAIQEAWTRADTERVEIACTGGRGRTGTGLACIAILDGLPNHQAVPYIRLHYSPHAVETPWQHRFVMTFR